MINYRGRSLLSDNNIADMSILNSLFCNETIYSKIAKLSDSEKGRRLFAKKLGISEKTFGRMEAGLSSRIENWITISKVVNLFEK